MYGGNAIEKYPSRESHGKIGGIVNSLVLDQVLTKNNAFLGKEICMREEREE